MVIRRRQIITNPNRPTIMQCIRSVGLTSGLINVIDAADAECVKPGYQQLYDLSGNNNHWLYGTTLAQQTTDPFFVGTSGKMNEEAYLSTNPNDLATESQVRKFTNTTINDNAWHQNNGAFSAVFVVSVTAIVAGTNTVFRLLGNGNEITSAADNCFNFWLNNSPAISTLSLLTDVGTGASDAQVTSLNATPAGPVPDLRTLFCGVSYNEAGPTVILRFCGLTSSTTTTASVNVTAPANNLTAAGPAAGSAHGLTQRKRVHSWAIWSTALTSANLESLYNNFKQNRYNNML